MSSDKNSLSQLFTLRVWRTEDDAGEVHLRGKLHHVNDDEIRYFDEWASLMPLLFSMLKSHESKLNPLEKRILSKDEKI